MTHRPLTIALLVSALGVGVALSGCGKTGELQQPAPLFGAKAKADYDAEQKAKAEEAAKRATPQPASADPTDQPLDQAPYAQPIPGHSDPFGRAPAGSLPNPGTAPDQ
jgi:hypothetical protein